MGQWVFSPLADVAHPERPTHTHKHTRPKQTPAYSIRQWQYSVSHTEWATEGGVRQRNQRTNKQQGMFRGLLTGVVFPLVWWCDVFLSVLLRTSHSGVASYIRDSVYTERICDYSDTIWGTNLKLSKADSVEEYGSNLPILWESWIDRVCHKKALILGFHVMEALVSNFQLVLAAPGSIKHSASSTIRSCCSWEQ